MSLTTPFAITLKFASTAVADQMAVLARTGASIVPHPISAFTAFPPSKVTVGLNGELKVVDGAFLRVFVVELAGDAVLFEFEGCGGHRCCLGYGLPVQIDRCAALGVSPRPVNCCPEIRFGSRTQATS